MLDAYLNERNLPSVTRFAGGGSVADGRQWQRRREEIIDVLCREEYGFPPPEPVSVTAETLEQDRKFCAGRVILSKVKLICSMECGTFAFPIMCAIPREGRVPAFVHISFTDQVPDRYMPTEEICDHGFAIASFYYQDVCVDKDDGFSSGLAAVLYPEGKRRPDDAGKIAMWAWAARRTLDYLLTLDCIDRDCVAVAGHSRLGKTALLTGALDQRFSYVMPSGSGCSGAAISRGKTGERIRNIYTVFPYWFCTNFGQYMDRESELPFDQHFLLSLIAPRRLYVAAAREDTWADPDSEYLSCVAASPVYEMLGHTGFIHPDRLPQTGDVFGEGRIGYHLRPGGHYLGRYEWQQFIGYIQAARNQ